tara:strand:+ start:287 stop:868 length:582 start_codon:yes stop_codon:yes gene_type:complete
MRSLPVLLFHLLSGLLSGLLVAATGCQSSPRQDKGRDWIELLDSPTQRVAVQAEGFVPEAFTGEALEFRETPSALELLQAHGYQNAAALAGATGVWPTIPLPSGYRLPDPGHAARKLFGLEFEPRYVIVREANALILRTGRGSRVVPLDPEQPVGFPEDGSPAQRRARNAFLRGFDRDHRALDQPRVDPRVEP